MNTYYKFAPNVFLAKCDEKHERGEEILVTTKYGKENACIVFNLIAEKVASTTIPSSEQMVSMFKSGRSKERNAEGNGLHPQNAIVLNFITSQIRMLISFLSVSLLKSDIIAKSDTAK